MRFKAEVRSPAALNRLVASVEKLSQRGILKLTREKVYIICAGERNTSGGPQVWAQINVDSVFSDFKIESNTDNQIFLEFIPTALSKALRSSNGATAAVLRLAKRASNGCPVISCSFSGSTKGGHVLDISQEVPVRVLKLAELEDMAKEPMCPEPDVHIMLPLPSDIMRGVVERMKNLDSIIHVSANQEGVMKLRVQSDLANVETEWRGLSKPDVDQSSQPVDEVDPSEFHTVAIEAKHLLKLLNALKEGSHTIACICAGYCLIAYLYVGDTQVETSSILTFYVPGHTDGD